MNFTLITGASGGIGYELAKIFAKNNHNLILVANEENKLKEVQNELSKYNIKIEIIAKDLTDDKSVDEIYLETKNKGYNIDILVNNAGFGDLTNFVESNFEKQEKMVKLNIMALMHLTYLYGADMKKRKSGKILNVASIAAFCPGPYMSVYYASKAFVLSFSVAVSEELKNEGITVTSLCPPPTKTGFEKAAGMPNSHMFSLFNGGINPNIVAQKGYKGLIKGKKIVTCTFRSKIINIGTRLISRSLASKLAKKINGNPINKVY